MTAQVKCWSVLLDCRVIYSAKRSRWLCTRDPDAWPATAGSRWKCRPPSSTGRSRRRCARPAGSPRPDSGPRCVASTCSPAVHTNDHSEAQQVAAVLTAKGRFAPNQSLLSLVRRPELSMGPFCVTRSNPTHPLTDPTQSNSLQVEKNWTQPDPTQYN